MTNLNPGQSKHIKTFDAVRAMAIILVFLYHAGYLLTYSKNGFIDWYRLVNKSGTVGVSVFFILSGFLLFYQMYKKKEALTAIEVKEYIKKRLLRILPLYYFSIFFIVLFLRHDILFAADGLRSIIYNLLFIRGINGTGWLGGSTIPINPVYWSLVIEMHFYLLLPIFYYIFYKYKKIRWFFLLALAGLAYRIFLVILVKSPSMQFLRLTPANFDFFALGMLGAYLYVNRGKWFEFVSKKYIQWLALILFVVFMYFYDLEFYPTVAYVFAPVFLSLIVVFGMLSFLGNEQSFLAKIVTCSPMLFIAKISFSIYIWHAIVINKVGGLPLSNDLKFVLNVAITLVVSTLTYYVIEAPFLKLKYKGGWWRLWHAKKVVLIKE